MQLESYGEVAERDRCTLFLEWLQANCISSLFGAAPTSSA